MRFLCHVYRANLFVAEGSDLFDRAFEWCHPDTRPTSLGRRPHDREAVTDFAHPLSPTIASVSARRLTVSSPHQRLEKKSVFADQGPFVRSAAPRQWVGRQAEWQDHSAISKYVLLAMYPVGGFVRRSRQISAFVSCFAACFSSHLPPSSARRPKW